jgi:hypothetical protein
MKKDFKNEKPPVFLLGEEILKKFSTGIQLISVYYGSRMYLKGILVIA